MTLSLDACWHYFRSPEGRAYLNDVEERLRADRCSLEFELLVMDDRGGLVEPPPKLPSDRFEAAVTQHHKKLVMTPHADWWPPSDASFMDVAAVMALRAAATEDGQITKAAVLETFGPDGAALHERLEQGVTANTFKGNAKAKYRLLPQDARLQIARSRPPKPWRALMPLVEEIVDRAEEIAGVDRFDDWSYLSVKHAFESTLGEMDALRRIGFERRRLICKRYSSDPDAIVDMELDGVRIADGSSDGALKVRGGIGLDRCLANATGSVINEGIRRWAKVFGEANPSEPSKAFIREVLNNAKGDSGHETLLAATQTLGRMLEDVDPNTKEALPKLLFIDDGGKMLEALHRFFPEYARFVAAGEQTAKGVMVLEKLAEEGVIERDARGRPMPLCPVINMAESPLKKHLGMAFFSASVTHSAFSAMADLHPRLRPTKPEAAIIGFGAQGRPAAGHLIRDHGYRAKNIWVFDEDPAKRQQARDMGYRVPPEPPMKADARDPAYLEAIEEMRRAVLSHAHLLIAATGHTSVTLQDVEYMPHEPILVSASSGNHELGTNLTVEERRRLKDEKTRRTRDGSIVTRFHGLEVKLAERGMPESNNHRVFQLPSGKRALVLRGGKVINMFEDIPAPFIQLERSMLVATALLAIRAKNEGRTGLIDFDPKLAAEMEASYRAKCRSLGLDPEHPDLARARRIQDQMEALHGRPFVG